MNKFYEVTTPFWEFLESYGLLCAIITVCAIGIVWVIKES